MPWPVHPTGFFGAQGDNDTYKIERSLRFNSADSAYLNRTPSTSNQKTYTFNFWVKRSSISLASDVEIFSALFAATSSRYAYIAFEADDTLSFFSGVYSTGASTTVSYQYRTTQVFRDPSAWYMITAAVDTTNTTASERVKLYVNGTQITSFSTEAQPALNQNGYWNSPQFHGIGTFNGSTGMFPGYLAEINFIDGQQLAPSSFGETDAITGRWKARAYSGTYGTNGFYLKFADNSGTTSTTLGKDSSPNGNNWTPNNFSVTAGVGNDSLVDSPTNYGTDTGVGGEVRGNYATYSSLSPVVAGGGSALATLANGNLDASSASASFFDCFSTFNVPSSGKWYLEWTITAVGTNHYLGIGSRTSWSSASKLYQNSGSKVVNGTTSSYGLSYTTNDVIGMALDMDAGTMTMYKNNSSQGVLASDLISAMPSDGWAIIAEIRGTASHSVNFGQRPFAYSAPTGFRSLCTTNLPTPTIRKPSSAMDVVTYTGNGSARSITGLGFSPDLVWIKGRSGATDHAIYDSVRGVQKDLGSNLTTDETTQTQGLTAFNSDGFDIGTLAKINTNTSTYVAWAWDRAAIDGLDIVSYTGNGANRTIAHNLGVAPKMIIVKARTTAGADQGWPVYHSSLANTQYLLLNSTAAAATGADYWNSTSPTSSVFSVGTNVAVNANNDTYIAYLFAEVEGFSKFGSYVGNNSTDGPFVFTGFRPRWVLLKSLGTGPWSIYDTARNTGNIIDGEIRANTNETENGFSFVGDLDILSNGFKVRSDNNGAWFNPTGNGVVIFAAFAESPFKYARAR